MEELVFRISRSYITGLAGLLGLGAVTYLIKRYLSNTTVTSNSYYIKMDSMAQTSNLAALTQIQTPGDTKNGKVYIFWNGDVKSTYLLIDQLLQDKIIQPLYIERYTILKILEHDRLEEYTKLYNTNRKACTQEMLEYLADIAKLKRKQTNETSQIEILRSAINNQYPEFKMNFLPTQYITSIAKDLAHSQAFYDIITSITQNSSINNCQINGIEFFEQASRYIKHSQLSKSKSRVMLGYSKDSHLIKIIKKITENTNPTFSKIEMPLRNIDNDAIRYLATEVNPVVMGLLPTRKD